MTDLYFVAGKLYAGTQENGIFVSENYGGDWKQSGQHFPDASVVTLIKAGYFIYAGTEDKGVYELRGINWGQIYDQNSNSRISDFAVIDRRLFTAAFGGGVLRLNDSFELDPVNDGLEDLRIKALHYDGKTLFAGTYGDGLYRSADEGENWEQIGNGVHALINTIAVHDSVILLGSDGGGLFRSEDYGESWEHITLSELGSEVIVSLVGENDTWYLSQYPNHIYRSDDSGQTWVRTAADKIGEDVIVRDLVLADQYIIAGTENSGIYRAEITEDEWTKIEKQQVTKSVHSLAVWDGKLFAAVENEGIIHSPDYGATWTKYENELPASAEFEVLSVWNDIIYAGADDGFVWFDDRDSTWESVNHFYGLHVRAIAHSDDYIYAALSHRVSRSDNGRIWSTLPDHAQLRNILTLTGSGDKVYAGTAENGLFLLEDTEREWRTISLFLPEKRIQAIALIQESIFAGTPSGVFRLRDLTAKWEEVNTGLDSSNITVLYTHKESLLAGTNSGLFVSSNNGDEWKAAGGDTLSFNITSITVQEPYIILGTSEHGVKKIPLNEVIPVSSEHGGPSGLPHSFSLLQNYPNPFNPSTVISYQVPVNSEVILKVFDLLGREVAILVDGRISAGSHQVRFEAAGLSSGIYIYTLETGDGKISLSKKLTLIK